MSTTLDEIVYDILSSAAGESRINQDQGIDTELVQFKIINRRAFLIRQDQEKGRSLSNNIQQVLTCVPVKYIDVSECPCYVSSDCKILRTVNQLPRVIELYQKDLLTKVSGTGVTSRSWSIISFARASVSGTSQFTKDNTKVFLHNSYIYVINPPEGIEYITVNGVFEDPREVSKLYNCEGKACYSSSDPFPISAHMVPVLKQLVLQDLLPLLQSYNDERGDERFDKGRSPSAQNQGQG